MPIIRNQQVQDERGAAGETALQGRKINFSNLYSLNRDSGKAAAEGLAAPIKQNVNDASQAANSAIRKTGEAKDEAGAMDANEGFRNTVKALQGAAGKAKDYNVAASVQALGQTGQQSQLADFYSGTGTKEEMSGLAEKSLAGITGQGGLLDRQDSAINNVAAKEAYGKQRQLDQSYADAAKLGELTSKFESSPEKTAIMAPIGYEPGVKKPEFVLAGKKAMEDLGIVYNRDDLALAQKNPQYAAVLARRAPLIDAFIKAQSDIPKERDWAMTALQAAFGATPFTELINLGGKQDPYPSPVDGEAAKGPAQYAQAIKDWWSRHPLPLELQKPDPKQYDTPVIGNANTAKPKVGDRKFNEIFRTAGAGVTPQNGKT